MLKLTELDRLPAGFFDLISACDLHTILPGPTLLHLQGEREPRLFVSVLQHGNENTGFHVIQRLLDKYRKQPLPRSLSVFFSNVSAAAQGKRRLEGQPDYNRVWPGSILPDCPEIHLMATVMEKVTANGLFANVDVHNNTGKNPYYSCISTLDPRTLRLAQYFSGTALYFEALYGTQACALSDYCPAITIECGQPGIPEGIEHTLAYLERILQLDDLPDEPVSEDFRVYQSQVRVTLPNEYSFSFNDPQATIRLSPGLEEYNFRDLPAGTVLASTADPAACLQAWNDAGQDAAMDYFAIRNGEISLKQDLLPAMVTPDETIIRQDCLCYLAKRLTFGNVL